MKERTEAIRLTDVGPEAALAIVKRHGNDVTIELASPQLSLSVAQVARALGVQPPTIKAFIASGELRTVALRPKGRGPSIVVPWDDAVAFAKRAGILAERTPRTVTGVVLVALSEAGDKGLSAQELEAMNLGRPDAVRLAVQRAAKRGEVRSNGMRWSRSHWWAEQST